MKKLLLVSLLMCAFSAVFAYADKVEVSFTYTKQSGIGSNQFAVWIEDARGEYVRTLFATKFTAIGGWRKRELALPVWVKQSKLADMNKGQIDAVSGATPKNGLLKYTWNGRDSNGRTLPPGEYKVFVEASLRNENHVLYTAVVQLDNKTADVTVNAEASYSGASTAERGMIGPVTVSY